MKPSMREPQRIRGVTAMQINLERSQALGHRDTGQQDTGKNWVSQIQFLRRRRTVDRLSVVWLISQVTLNNLRLP
jgi:hypothetical protein